MIRMHEIEVQKARTCILKVDRLEIAPGRRLLVQGRNGAGKSTLLRVLAGLEQPSSGQLEGLPERRARVLVHQAPFVFRGSVVDNLVLGMKARRFTRAERLRGAEETLEAFALTALAARSARSLSGGERRRLALARALILEPELLLLDEPLSDLDEAGQAALAAALEVRKRMTVVTASPVRMPDFLAQEIHELRKNVDAI